MNSRSRRTTSLATKSAELALAAPAVVAHRLARLATSGPAPSARDRREFRRMGAEKSAAFAESWSAMGTYWWGLQQVWTKALWRWTLAPWSGAMPWPPNNTQWQRALQGVMARGLAPVHRRAVANAKRLGRPTPRR